jgi:hypothetical protein
VVPEIEAALQELGIDYDYKKSEYLFTLDIGSRYPARILCRTTEPRAVNNVRGVELGSWWADEARDMDSASFDVVFDRLRCRKTKIRKLLVTSTPNGYDHLYERFVERPRSGKPGCQRWALIQAPSDANTDLPEEYLQEILGRYDGAMSRQERGGEFVALGSGRVYSPFDRDDHVGAVAYDKTRRLALAADFNRGFYGWSVCQAHPRSKRNDRGGWDTESVVHVLGEVCSRKDTIEEAVAELLEKWGHHKGGWDVYPDAAGVTQSNRQTGMTDVAAMEQAIRTLAPGSAWVFHSPKSNPRVRERVTAVNAMLRNALGVSRMVIDASCIELIADLEKLQWTKSGDIDKKNAERSHVSDGLGYYIWSDHGPSAFVRERNWRSRRRA